MAGVKNVAGSNRRSLVLLWCLIVLGAVVGLSACGREEIAEPPAAAPSTWSGSTDDGLYRLALAPRDGPALIGEFQDWVVEVRDAGGVAQHPVRVFIDGGMPEHGHGLPTRPQVGEHLGDGRYLVEGMRFNMAGTWVMQISVEGPAGRDSARLELALAF